MSEPGLSSGAESREKEDILDEIEVQLELEGSDVGETELVETPNIEVIVENIGNALDEVTQTHLELIGKQVSKKHQSVFSQSSHGNLSLGSQSVPHELVRQVGKAEKLVTSSRELPTKDRIKAFNEANHVFSEETGLRYSFWKSSFGSVFTSVDSDFAELGPGVNSYFSFLKIFGTAFVLFSLLYIPAVVFNIACGSTLRDTFGQEAPSKVSATTIGNLFQPEDAFNISNDYFCDLGPSSNFTVSRLTIQELNVGLDIFVSLFFLLLVQVSICVFRAEQDRWVIKNPALESFTVQVNNLPQEATYESLTEHFNKVLRKIENDTTLNDTSRDDLAHSVLGLVYDVQIVTATKKELSLAIEHARLGKKVDHLEIRLALATEQLNNNEMDLKTFKKISRQHDKSLEQLRGFWTSERVQKMNLFTGEGKDDAKVVTAFVSFDNILARSEVFRAYNKKLSANFWGKKKRYPEELLYMNTKIQIKNAAPPSVIKWENMEETRSSRRLRSTASFFTVFFILLLTAILLYLSGDAEDSDLFGILSSEQRELMGEGSCFSLNITELDKQELCGADFVEVDRDLDLDCFEYVFCQCVDRVSQLDSSITDDRECRPFIVDGAYTLVFTFINALIVTIINVVLEAVIFGSVSFERDSDRTKEEKKLFVRIFLSTFINTALVKLLHSFDLETLFDFNIPLLGTGEFSDFSNQWYGSVGSDFIFIGLGNVFGPHIMSLGVYAYTLLKRKLNKPISMQDIETLYLGPQFVLSVRYAQIFMGMAFGLMYSSGMPILYVTTAFTCLVAFWVDKYLLLYFCRKPINYSNEIILWICHALKYLILLHSFMSIFILSVPELFPIQRVLVDVQAVSGNPFLESLQNSTDTINPDFINRITNGPVVFLTAFFLLLVVILLLNQFEEFLSLMKKLGKKANKLLVKQIEKRRGKENRVLKELEQLEKLRQDKLSYKLDMDSLNGVTSYNILANPAYRINFKLREDMSQTVDALTRRSGRLHSTHDVIKLLDKDNRGENRAFVFSPGL